MNDLMMPLTHADIARRQWHAAFVRTWLDLPPNERQAQWAREMKLARRWLNRASAAAVKAEEVGTIDAQMRASAICRRAADHVERFQLLDDARSISGP
jgi:hypothetical protein